ncbi:MAG: multiprotein bridging factor aMBF1 [Candidatus Diapherotrites archaeon]
MNCEICGKEAGKRVSVNIDGTIFDVCEACSKYGTKIEVPSLPKAKIEKPSLRQFNERSERDLFKTDEFLIDNYGSAVRKAREKKGLTVKEFAQKLFEKESVIHRVERNEFKPGDKLTRKIESFFGIKLKEKLKEE